MDATLNANAGPRVDGDLVRFGGDLLKKALARKSSRSFRPSLTVAAWLFLLSLHHAAFAIAWVRRIVSRATERDRPKLLALARRLGTMVTTLDATRQELEQSGIASPLPIKGRRALRRLSELAEEADDIAEDAALGASAAFAEFVDQELAKVGPGALER